MGTMTSTSDAGQSHIGKAFLRVPNLGLGLVIGVDPGLIFLVFFPS